VLAFAFGQQHLSYCLKQQCEMVAYSLQALKKSVFEGFLLPKVSFVEAARGRSLREIGVGDATTRL
jgi:hypothetical protein